MYRESVQELVDLPVQVQFPEKKSLQPFAGLKIPKASDYVGVRPRGQFVCDRCGRSYMRKDSLQRHMQWECGKEPQFQCPYCTQRCKRKAHWLRHIRRQHDVKDATFEIYKRFTTKIEIDWAWTESLPGWRPTFFDAESHSVEWKDSNGRKGAGI